MLANHNMNKSNSNNDGSAVGDNYSPTLNQRNSVALPSIGGELKIGALF